MMTDKIQNKYFKVIRRNPHDIKLVLKKCATAHTFHLPQIFCFMPIQS